VLRVVLSPRWLWRHVLLVVAVGTCFVFGRWQLGRAVDRHSVLNWSYAIEWALFAVFALVCWGWYLRDDLRGGAAARPEEPPGPVYLPQATPVTDDEDPELAEYNRYLASLNEKLNRKEDA
jgi:hypothetical protein